MREFCQSPDCDGLINFGSDSDGEIGACEKCGRQYELKAEYYVSRWMTTVKYQSTTL